MTRLRVGATRCYVHSFKEGLLARVAHDLRLEVKRVELDLGEDGLPLRARFFPESMQLVCSMHGGVPGDTVFSASDRAKIHRSLREDVLAVGTYPEIVFAFETIEPRDGGYQVRGALTLHGHTRPLTITSRAAGDCQVAEVTLHQPDWGITPFSAMFGALKVKAGVMVRIEVEVG